VPESEIGFISIIEAIDVCLSKNLNFAAYRLPNREHSELVVQNTSEKIPVSRSDSYFDLKGFLVSPFSDSEQNPTFIIRPDIYAVDGLTSDQVKALEALETVPIQSDESHIPDEMSQDEYQEQIRCILSNIEEGYFEKVVLSRVINIEGDYVPFLSRIFSRLTANYPNAFVYIFNAGPHLWVGATPEPLLNAQNGKMFTVSLAGTRPYNSSNENIGAWNSKERLEQEYVTRYISKVLSKFNLVNVDLEGPYTKKAGNLIHLRTDFSFRSAELKDCLGEFLRKLHPTPAVCGMPLNESQKLLHGLEKHNREYYAGFLGPVGLNDRLSLFVNLRCMKVLQNTLALFVGGGITADSVPEDEWQETNIKAETLLAVIKNIKT
jgi:isochorismate synthase